MLFSDIWNENSALCIFTVLLKKKIESIFLFNSWDTIHLQNIELSKKGRKIEGDITLGCDK